MKETHFKVLRWLPVVAALSLAILIAIISMALVKELNEAIYWRRHTFQVILEAQAYESDLMEAQSSIQRFAGGGDQSFLLEYQNDTNSELQEFNKLSELVSDNPEQQKRLRELDAAVRAVFDYDNRVIGVYARQGSADALRLEEAPESGDVVATAVADLENFKAEEKRLLDKRDATEQLDYHKAAHWLVGGGISVALLLVLANFFASREMARRRQAEVKQRELIDELQQTLAEVKTLSGMIPICGWCKKLRSDQGFWQSVEQYVGTHTGAKFTHGMCPICAQKWEADVAKSKVKS